ncbi:MAG TPA: DeoR/GlpR family DNA-binding transcription regulator [Aggregatilineales bacterium]|nr:DeoR/GlpR family DNA-binding transcription regulator [Aggregatilineales bacterium]
MSDTHPLQRQETILRLLAQQGEASVRGLAEALAVSEWTIRRDLIDLENRRLLTRQRGGAVILHADEAEVLTRHGSLSQSARENRAGKRRIGELAASLLREGQSIVLGAGSTTTRVARSLKHLGRPARVMTNALNIAIELANQAHLQVICTGGIVHGGYFTLSGPQAIQTLREQVYDVAIIGVSGITLREGLTVGSQKNTDVLAVMMDQARETWLVADSSRIGQVRFARLAPLAQVQKWITDQMPPAEYRDYCAAAGVELRVAGI